jgi:hypothetical protein
MTELRPTKAIGFLRPDATLSHLVKTKFEHCLLLFKYRGTRAAAAVVEKTKFEHNLLPLKCNGTRAAAAVVEKTKFKHSLFWKSA